MVTASIFDTKVINAIVFNQVNTVTFMISWA